MQQQIHPQLSEPFTTKGFNIAFVDQFSRQVFMKYDHDRSGQISGNEFSVMIKDFFAMLNIPSPTQVQTYELMYDFDLDKDQKLSYREFKYLLTVLARGGKK